MPSSNPAWVFSMQKPREAGKHQQLSAKGRNPLMLDLRRCIGGPQLILFEGRATAISVLPSRISPTPRSASINPLL